MTPYANRWESAMSSWSDYDLHNREAFNSSFGSSLLSTPPWQFSTQSQKVSSGSSSMLGVGPAFLQTSMAPYYSNGNILYSPLGGHDFLGDIPAQSFDSSTPPVKLGGSAEDFVNPLQTYFESCPPLTPSFVDISWAALNSPLIPYSYPTGNFFISDTSPLSHSVPPSTSSSLSATPVRKVSSQKVLERSATIHCIQSSIAQATKQEITSPQLEVDYVAVRVHKCTIPGCKSGRGFKRLEHLKRHQKTHDKKWLKCKYCQKILFQVDRSDNYRQHVYLHATPDRKRKRIKFDVGALAEVAAWEKAKPPSFLDSIPGSANESISMDILN